jgi:hypothetical protein
MFIAALFTIAKTGNNQDAPLVRLARFRRPKVTCSLLYWRTGPIQIQQYYEKQATLRGGDTRERSTLRG